MASWLIGWSSWIGQVTSAPSVDYALAAMILAAASINNPEYIPTKAETFLLTLLLVLIHSVITSMPTKWIARLNTWGTYINMSSLIVVLVMIPAGTTNKPRFTSSKEVWGTITNGTDYPDGVAILMSFLAVLWTMSG